MNLGDGRAAARNAIWWNPRLSKLRLQLSIGVGGGGGGADAEKEENSGGKCMCHVFPNFSSAFCCNLSDFVQIFVLYKILLLEFGSLSRPSQERCKWENTADLMPPGLQWAVPHCS